jgi:drug/metabolite transporter (DMT)-like permease
MCSAAIFIKASHAPGIVTAFYRMAVATVVLFIPLIIYLRRTTKKLSRKGMLFAMLGGLFFGADLSMWSTGVVMSNATIPTLMANLAPIWVGLSTIFILHKRLKAGFWLGLMIALIGILIMIHQDIRGANTILPGTLLGVGAGFFYGMFYLMSEPGRKLLDTLPFLCISTVSSAALLALLTYLLGYSFTGYDLHTWRIFLGIGLVVQVCGWFLINYSQGYLPATTVSPTLLGQPVLTYFLAALFLNEYLTLWHISGGAIVVIGIYLVHYSRKS